MTIYDDLLAEFTRLNRRVQYLQESSNQKATSAVVNDLQSLASSKASETEVAGLGSSIANLSTTTTGLQAQVTTNTTNITANSAAIATEVTRAQTAEAGLAKKDLSNPEAQNAIATAFNTKNATSVVLVPRDASTTVANQLFVDSADNKLKFRDASNVVRTVTVV